MTMLPVNWSEKDQKYYIFDVSGEVLWFDSSLNAKDELLEVMLQQTAMQERAKIVEWLRAHPSNPEPWLLFIASQIERGEHLPSPPGEG